MRIAFVLVLVATLLLVPTPATLAEENFVFSGSGWGHQIGMSQWGARGLAEQGRSSHDIVTHYYSGTSVASYPMPSEVRVGVLWDRTDALEVEGSGGLGMEFRQGGFIASFPPGQRWSVSATSDGRFHIKKADGSTAGIVGDANNHLSLHFQEFGTLMRLVDTGNRYRYGRLEMNVFSSGGGFKLRAVLIVPSMDHYLFGLGEMPSSWHGEALRAQAIAGRTYAADKIRRLGQNRPTCNCGLYSSTLDQAYVGFEKETGSFAPNWTGAVSATSGQAVLHGGVPIQAYYSSSTAGSSESNEDVWGGSPLPYLRARHDIWSRHPLNPNSLWTVTLSQSFIASRVGLQSVSAVNLSERTAGGGIKTARITGNTGSGQTTISMTGDSFRSKLGLKSITLNLHQFSEFILVMNSGNQTANVDVTLMFPDREPVTHSGYTVGPGSRRTIPIDDLLSSGESAVKLTSDQPVAAERAMYFYQAGSDDGHETGGATAPSTTWYFAEGATHSGFSQFILLSNPDPSQGASVRLDFSSPSGAVSSMNVDVPAGRRRTVAVNTVVPGQDVATTVTSQGAPVVAERAMYFATKDGLGYPAVDGGSDSIGVTAPSQQWYLAEGATHSGFSTFVLVYNPNPESVLVAIDLLNPAGSTKTVWKELAGRSRFTLSLNAEIPGQDVSTVVRSMTSGKGVVAERAVYFMNGLFDGGTAVMGAPETSAGWHLAEGATHSGFSTFVLLMNPNDQTVTASIDLLTPTGVAKTLVRQLPSRTRATISLNAELPGQDVSTIVRSMTPGLGLVVERAMYFSGRGIDGGHAGMALPALSKEWYFSEGFTSG